MSIFSDLAKKATNASPVTDGREKITIPELCRVCADGFTVIMVDMLSSTDDKTGEMKEFPALVAEELPDRYFFGGQQLKTIVDAWLEHCNGSVDDLNQNLYEVGGCKMTLTLTRTKKGQQFYAVTVLS